MPAILYILDNWSPLSLTAFLFFNAGLVTAACFQAGARGEEPQR